MAKKIKTTIRDATKEEGKMYSEGLRKITKILKEDNRKIALKKDKMKLL